MLGKLVVDSLNYAFEYGELSNSQKQAVITLIEKKGKDKRLVKNWRPIFLLNVDAKLASKTLAKRLEKVLLEVIHFNQNAFVKGRTIFDAVRTIDDVIEYARSEANAKTPSSLHEIANEVIWNNKSLCINKKSVYRRDIADLGFLKICDLFSTKENLNPEQGFFIMGIINNSMPASWRLTVKRATTAPVIDPLPDSPAILISNNLVPILDASSKQIYRLFLEKKETTPTAKVKLAAKYSNIDID